MKRILIYMINALLLCTVSEPVRSADEEPVESYDLKAFIALVEQQNKDLQLAEKETELAGAQKKEALSLALPHIAAQGGYNRNLGDNYLFVDFPNADGETVSQKFKITRNNEYAFHAVLQQTLFSMQVGNALKAAKQYRQLTDFGYEARQQGIITVAKKIFYRALLLKKIWEVSENSQKNAHENYLDVKNKFDNGVVSEFALLQSEVRWKNLIPETTGAERNYLLALIDLKNFAGLSTERKIDLVGDLEHFPARPDVLPFDDILQQRPDFKALQWERELRATNIQAEKSAYFPSLNGTFTYAYSAYSDEWKLDNENKNYIVGLNLSIPIFTGGYTRAQVQKARIEVDKADIRIQQKKDDIYKEIENISLRLDEAYKRIESAAATQQTAAKAFEIAEVSTKNGRATQLELKETRVAFDQAKLNYYAAVFDYLSAYFDWQQAIGRVE